MIRNFGESLASTSGKYVKSVTLNNQPCQAKPSFVDTNSNKTLFFQFTVSIKKFAGSFNTINGAYALYDCVGNKVKNMSVRALNLMSGYR